MSGELRGEYKLLKVWECHRCKVLVRHGKDISTHKCDVKENESQSILIENQKNIIGDKDRLIGEQKNIIEDKDKLLGEQKNIIGDKDRLIGEQKKIIEDKDKLLGDQKRITENQRRAIGNRDDIIESQKKTIGQQLKSIEEQKITIEDQKRITKENDIDNSIFQIDNKNRGKQICVDILGDNSSIKDSKDIGYREDIEFEIFAKGKGKERVVIKNGKVHKKPDDILLIGQRTPGGFIIRGLYKSESI